MRAGGDRLPVAIADLGVLRHSGRTGAMCLLLGRGKRLTALRVFTKKEDGRLIGSRLYILLGQFTNFYIWCRTFFAGLF